MCRSNTSVPSTAPLALSSLAEHVIKIALYSLVLLHAFNSYRRSATAFSSAVNALVGLLFLRMTHTEVNFLNKRIWRRLPPGYLGFPIIREINFLRTIASGGIHEALAAARAKYGSIFAQSFFGRANVAMGGQDDLRWLFGQDARNNTEIAWPPNIRLLLGPGAVANQSGKYHRALRRLMEPYFGVKFVENYLTSMDNTTIDQLESWAESSKDGKFLSSEVFKMYALRLFYASSFGYIDEAVCSQLHDDFITWLGGFMSMTGATRIPGSAVDEGMKARDRILATMDVLMDKFTEENPEDSERAQTTVIGRLIYGKDKDDNRMMTRDEAKDNMLNLIFAGHDTTFASISSLLYHLSENPDAMEALAEEVSELSEPLTSAALKNAPVLNACMHESWRMDPSVLGSFRKATKELQHKGYTFDAGTVFNYSILMATTDEALYGDHQKFNFRRFLPKSHPLYVPSVDAGIDPLQGRSSYPIFGGGAHVCLGKSFAQLELRVLTARLFRKYDVKVQNAEKIWFPVNGRSIEFRLTERKDL
ncbi:hypothetical protein ACHAXT_010932 [Thalassiosira profunda]